MPFSGKILLVEDHTDTRRAMAKLLRREGYYVVEAATGSDAMAKVAGHDIALLDVDLPDQSGIDVLKQIRAQGGKTSVAFVTATGHRDLLEQLEALPGTPIFKKPIDFDRLLDWVKQQP